MSVQEVTTTSNQSIQLDKVKGLGCPGGEINGIINLFKHVTELHFTVESVPCRKAYG